MRRWLASLVFLLVLCGGSLGFVVLRRYQGFSGEKLLEIPRGLSTLAVARFLEQEGVVRSSSHFLAARALRPRATLQAGEYRFAAPDSPLGVLNRLARGDVHYYELPVPEGSSVFDIARTLEGLKLVAPQEFLAAARDPGLIRDIAPKAPSLEGYLFPDTYRITRHTSAQDLCRQMTRRFRAAWKSLAATADPHQTVTFASLVEKETGAADERPLVASVYANRMRKGMKLDCDPTTVYAALLEGRYRGTIYRSDLDSKHPYNTYQHAGLPPGPIASPGFASLKAALAPAQTEYLYFVARPDGSGRHVFSKNLAAHANAAGNYRRVQNEHKQAQRKKAQQKKSPPRVSRRKKTGSRR